MGVCESMMYPLSVYEVYKKKKPTTKNPKQKPFLKSVHLKTNQNIAIAHITHIRHA